MTKLTELLWAQYRPCIKFTNPTRKRKQRMCKVMAPPALKRAIGAKEDLPKPGRYCQAELATMLQCLKAHDFKEDACFNEVNSFNSCYDDFKKRVEYKEELKDRNIIGLTVKSMTGKQKNLLLSKFPQPNKRVT